MHSHSEGWGGLFKDKQYRLNGNGTCSRPRVKAKRTRNPLSSKEFRKTLRNSLTAAEVVLWNSSSNVNSVEKNFAAKLELVRTLSTSSVPNVGLSSNSMATGT